MTGLRTWHFASGWWRNWSGRAYLSSVLLKCSSVTLMRSVCVLFVKQFGLHTLLIGSQIQ